MVTIQVFGHALRESLVDSELTLDVNGPTTVRKLLQDHHEQLGQILEYFNKGEVLVTVNRKVSTQDSPVNDGDTVRLTHQVHHSFEGARWHNP